MIAKCIICQFPINVEDGNPNYQLTECDEYDIDPRHAEHIAHFICAKKIAADEICSWTLA